MLDRTQELSGDVGNGGKKKEKKKSRDEIYKGLIPSSRSDGD